MDSLIKKRSIIRSSFTRIYNNVDNDITKNSDEMLVEANLAVFKNKARDLAKLDEEIIDLMLTEDYATADLEKEMTSADEYASKAKLLEVKYENYMKSKIADMLNASSDLTPSNEAHAKRKFKLPLLEFKKFGGDVREWLAFWGQFRKIHEDPDIAQEDKFQYLLQSTLPNSRAREIVESFPPISENYQKALDSLKSRFGRDELLVEVYVRELLKLTLNLTTSSDKPDLSSMYDRIETQLRALETLGVTSEKYAAMLFPLVESCLSEDLLRAWQRSSFTSGESAQNSKLGNLMAFLKQEVESEERISMAIEGFHLDSKGKNVSESTLPTAACLINVKSSKPVCIFCDGTHNSMDCYKARKFSLEEKRKVVRDKRCCFGCLKPNHTSKKCKTFLKCIVCEGRHVPLMCNKASVSVRSDKIDIPSVENNLSNVNCGQVLLKTLTAVIKGVAEKPIRVLFDDGSQRSYVRSDLAKQMEYQSIGSGSVVHALFGGSHSKPYEHQCYKVRLGSMDGKYACNFDALDQDVICSNVPTAREGPWLSELEDEGIKLTSDNGDPIDVLIGADVCGKLLTGKKKNLNCGLVAIETHLGWTIMGKNKNESSGNINRSMMVLSMLSTEKSLTTLWDLDVLGIEDPIMRTSKAEMKRLAKDHFEKTVCVNEDGRYEVQLPWLEDHPPLPGNFNLAKRRLDSTVKKMAGSNSFERYDAVLTEWLRDDVIEEIPREEWDNGHYLPHRPVFKENSTTPIRPVFDASAREQGCPSLNQCIDKGINLIELIPPLLLRFRLHEIGVIADIKKAFLQISLAREDRDFLRFLWFDKSGNLRIFRHTRVVFGVTCSPFLLCAVLDHHLKICSMPRKDGNSSYSSNTITTLLKSFYVDNCVASVRDEKELDCFIKESTDIFTKGKFDLRGWEFTNPELPLKGIKPTSVLGLLWDKKEDVLFVNTDFWESEDMNRITRRSVLSLAQRLFDPIGFLCPVTLFPKILLQKSWITKNGWDEELEEDLKHSFMAWMADLPLLKDIKIPRWITMVDSDNTLSSIHCFCDASQEAYAAAVFIRLENSSGVRIQLIQAKSRVAPIKDISIPRLELLAAVIGARLTTSILQEMEFKGLQLFFWSDSSTVIAWIKREEQWKTFVSNRVDEIRKLTPKEAWRHIPGKENPADLPSRGCPIRKFVTSKWWKGPEWLQLARDMWPVQENQMDEEEVIVEKKRDIISLLCENGDGDWYYSYFSRFNRIVRTIGWILRFALNCRLKRERVELVKGELLAKEMEEAELRVMKLVQKESFIGVQDKQLASLAPYEDHDGVIHLTTKVTERKDLMDFRLPVVLPSKHAVVCRLIYDTHVKNCHVGVQGLLSILREKYWILQGRRSVRTVISKCVICKRHGGRKMVVSSPPLPETRVRDAAVFEIIGVDLMGPLYTRENKVWICLFTCAVYRAIHLEIVSSLSSGHFLQAFRRFVARRGRPAIVYSDSGTDFTGENSRIQQCGTD